MSDVFPKWANRLPLQIVAGGFLAVSSVVAGLGYYFTPKYTKVAYQPLQPVSFNHNLHVGQLGMDCRYCHNGVEESWYANIPSSALCMNCHNQVLKDDPRLARVRDSAQSGQPIPWVKIHRTPDYVFFHHAVHVNRGVSCLECHGPIHQMDEANHAKPLSMRFCLDCHRNPALFLRPPSEIYNLNWKADSPSRQLADGRKFVAEWKVKSSQYCSSCHR